MEILDKSIKHVLAKIPSDVLETVLDVNKDTVGISIYTEVIMPKILVDCGPIGVYKKHIPISSLEEVLMDSGIIMYKVPPAIRNNNPIMDIVGIPGRDIPMALLPTGDIISDLTNINKTTLLTIVVSKPGTYIDNVTDDEQELLNNLVLSATQSKLYNLGVDGNIDSDIISYMKSNGYNNHSYDEYLEQLKEIIKNKEVENE